MEANALFMNIIKNSGFKVEYKDELINLHYRSQSLEKSIKLRKDMEYNYNKLKLNNLKNEIEELEFQKKFYIERNNDILKKIQKDRFISAELFSKTKISFEDLEESKNKYQKYIDDISPQIKTEFNIYLNKSKNVFKEEKSKEMEKKRKNEHKYDHYEELTKINDKLADDIQKLRKRNNEIIMKNEEIKQKYLEREKYLKKILNIPDKNEKEESEQEKKREKEEEEKLKNEKIELLQRQKLLRMPPNKIIINNSINNDEDKKSKEIPLKNIKNLNISDENNLKNLDKSSYNNEIKESKKEVDIKKQKEMERENDMKINQVLEDMCSFGNIMKKEIKKEKKENPLKFIKTEEALNNEEKDPGLFALGLLAKNLEDSGVETAIESEEDGNDDDFDAAATCLQFITNGMITKKKYDLHFDFGEERNQELIDKKEEYNKFKEKLKLKLSKDFNISPDKIIVTCPEKGSFRVQVIFQSDEFNNLQKEEFIKKFKNEKKKDFEELQNLKEIHEDVIMGACKLTKKQLDANGNRTKDWEEGGQRGNRPYDPPLGWIGIGLKVLGKYENDIWIGMKNIIGEWCVAYHGVGRFQNSDKVKNITGIIYKGNYFKPGEAQVYESSDDENHPGEKVGKGVYCTPKIAIAEGYAGNSEINGILYKTVLMVRVNPDKIRYSKNMKDYWVVDGTTDQIRPYRILYKKTSN